MVTAVAFANELERELAGQRARDAALKRAKEGRNFGGRVYGYNNIWVLSDGTQVEAPPSGKKPPDAQTIYSINELEVAVIREIFHMYTDGHGIKTIARTLNAFRPTSANVKPIQHASGRTVRNTHIATLAESREESLYRQYFGAVTPASPAKGTGYWAPSSVHAILNRECYRGFIPFGKTRKFIDNVEGTRRREKLDTEMLVEKPEPRIIPDELWTVVQERHAASRKTYLADTGGKLWGSSGNGAESKYLLTGIARCGCCDASMTSIGGRTGSPGKRQPLYYYGCAWRHNRGPTVCSNDTNVRMHEADEALLNAIDNQVLNADAWAYVANKALRIMEENRREQPDRPREIEVELKKLHRDARQIHVADCRWARTRARACGDNRTRSAYKRIGTRTVTDGR